MSRSSLSQVGVNTDEGIVLVMEMVPGGDLLENILSTGPVPEYQCRIWTAQIVDAIAVREKALRVNLD